MNNSLAVIYTRVSSDKQIDGYSLEVQEDRCRERASALGLVVPQNGIFREEGVSAKTMDRPELQKMLKFVSDKKNNIHAVITLDVSRFNRNTSDFLAVQAILARYGVRLIFCSHDSGQNAESKLINTVIASLAEYDNTKKGERVLDSHKKRFELGHVNQKPPTGYILKMINGHRVAVPDPELFPVIQRMWYNIIKFRWSLRKIAEELNNAGIHPSHNKGSKKFTRSLCSKMFSNKFYMGFITSQRFGEKKGMHEPMIDERTFYQVREILTSRKPTRKERYLRINPNFPLRGILRCNYCSSHITGAVSYGKNKERPIRYYCCQTRGVHTPNPSFPANDNKNTTGVETKFTQLLQTIEFDKAFIEWISEMVRESYEAKHGQFLKSEEMARKELIETQKLVKELNLKYLKKEFSKEEYDQLKKDLEIQLVIQEGVLNEYKMAKLDIDIILQWVKFYLTNIPRIWLDAEPEARYRIGCSLFPEGLYFDGKEFRTPTLGLAYQYIVDMQESGVSLGETNISLFEHLLNELVKLFHELNPFVTLSSNYAFNDTN